MKRFLVVSMITSALVLPAAVQAILPDPPPDYFYVSLLEEKKKAKSRQDLFNAIEERDPQAEPELSEAHRKGIGKIAQKISILFQVKYGNTPLHLAIMKHDTQMVGLLLSINKGLPAVANNAGELPMRMALQLNLFDIVERMTMIGE